MLISLTALVHMIGMRRLVSPWKGCKWTLFKGLHLVNMASVATSKLTQNLIHTKQKVRKQNNIISWWKDNNNIYRIHKMLDTILSGFYGIGLWIVYGLVSIAKKLFPEQFHKSIKGQTVLITGAGSGIGRITAQRLAEKGAKIITLDVNEKGNDETVRCVEQGCHFDKILNTLLVCNLLKVKGT